MRLTLALVVLLAACTQAAEPTKRVRKPPGPASVVSTITLPADDGRVHVVEIPGRHDLWRCLVHAGPQGSSIACLPAADAAPVEWEPER